ncbi:hypothetical protein O6H91_Y022500 [Diphasiastrum complanatum]|nr:hypothetical protein O6H91_Y022500 [Diphasiastrum complanatum]
MLCYSVFCLTFLLLCWTICSSASAVQINLLCSPTRSLLIPSTQDNSGILIFLTTLSQLDFRVGSTMDNNAHLFFSTFHQ